MNLFPWANIITLINKLSEYLKIFHQDTKTFLEIRNKKQGHEYYFCNFVFSSIKKKKRYTISKQRVLLACVVV